MGFAEIKKAVNTNLNVPINHLIWLNDYKTFGEDSYVFQNKDILHELYRDYKLCMNELAIKAEAFEYVLSVDTEVGMAFANIYGIEATDTLKSLSTMNAVLNSATAMNAVAGSTTAMNAVLNSATAMNAVLNSATAMNAVANSATAMNAVAGSTTAMNAVAGSTTAMNAVAGSTTAMNAVAGSTTAMNAIYSKATTISGAKRSYSGKFILLEISSGNSFQVNNYGWATLSDGSNPNWDSYRSKFAYFRQFKKYCTYVQNDTESDDWVKIFKIS